MDTLNTARSVDKEAHRIPLFGILQTAPATRKKQKRSSKPYLLTGSMDQDSCDWCLKLDRTEKEIKLQKMIVDAIEKDKEPAKQKSLNRSVVQPTDTNGNHKEENTTASRVRHQRCT